MKPHNCPNCGREVKILPKEWMGIDYDYYVCPSNDCDYRGFKKIEKQTWYFTIERDIPIKANSEIEAEILFRKAYPCIPILGIIRPLESKVNEDG